MRLRKQLFIASLFTLSLPWVGCQYIQEIDANLQLGQESSLRATAIAIAATLAADDQAMKELTARKAPAETTPLYFYPFESPLTLDGYFEEWQAKQLQSQKFAAHSQSSQLEDVQIMGAESSNKLWLSFRIPIKDITYYDPSKSIREADHLSLHLSAVDHTKREIKVVASSPGQAPALSVTGQSVEVNHQVNAIWREWSLGYQIELNIPKDWAASGILFEVFSHKDEQTPLYSNISRRLDRQTTPPIITHSPYLQNQLNIFARAETNLKIASSNAAFVAGADHYTPQTPQENTPWLLAFIYQLVLGLPSDAPLSEPEQEGFFDASEVLSALRGETDAARYRVGDQTISSVSYPIISNSKILGAVAVEQGTHSLQAFTNTAFNRLLMYSMAVMICSAAMLLLYASWLSFRIGRLSRSAVNAITETGKINEDFRASKIQDEVGDLSRSFAQLLSRLKEYTHYLKTLSSKLSHELRTPLAIVSSSLDNLEHEELGPQARVYAERAKQGSARLSNILNAMSAASRVEQAIGAAELEKIPVDQLLENLKGAYTDVYPKATFKLAVQENKAGYDLLASGELLVQMLDKLVDNAADFCPQGGLIEFGLYRQHDTLIITVRNEGPPLPGTMNRQLFDSMVSVREKPSESGAEHHLGLGLYIVRLIVDFHQGTVEGYNVPDNSGVIFEIRLPTNR